MVGLRLCSNRNNTACSQSRPTSTAWARHHSPIFLQLKCKLSVAVEKPKRSIRHFSFVNKWTGHIRSLIFLSRLDRSKHPLKVLHFNLHFLNSKKKGKLVFLQKWDFKKKILLKWVNRCNKSVSVSVKKYLIEHKWANKHSLNHRGIMSRNERDCSALITERRSPPIHNLSRVQCSWHLQDFSASAEPRRAPPTSQRRKIS